MARLDNANLGILAFVLTFAAVAGYLWLDPSEAYSVASPWERYLLGYGIL